MKKPKNLIIYVVNRIYSWNDKKYKDNLYIEYAQTWHLAYRNNSDYELKIEEISSFLSKCYSVEQLISNYDTLIDQYTNTFLLFNSFYDIDPTLNRAFHYIKRLLLSEKFKIFILSLNPYSDITNYLYRPKGIKELNRIVEDTDDNVYRGPYVEDIHIIPEFKRYKHSKYPDILLKFAAELRLGNDIVTYNAIKEATGIPKSTLYSYAERMGITLSKSTGRKFLNTKEKIKLENIIDMINYRY